MSDIPQDPWTDAQWTQVQETVRSALKEHGVAAAFMDYEGPEPRYEQTAVLQELTEVGAVGDRRREVADFDTRRLTTLSVTVGLRQSQVAEPGLSSALIAFKNAASRIARAQDMLVFQGQSAPGPFEILPTCIATGGAAFTGLQNIFVNPPVFFFGSSSPSLVSATSQAIGRLEGQGHVGPFAMILSSRAFDLAYTPTPNLVVPADRIKPLLEGPLLRSSTLLDSFFVSRGVLVSVGSDLMDLVIASEIGVRLTQISAVPSESPRYMFRVSERFTLRVKQQTAIVPLIGFF